MSWYTGGEHGGCCRFWGGRGDPEKTDPADEARRNIALQKSRVEKNVPYSGGRSVCTTPVPWVRQGRSVSYSPGRSRFFLDSASGAVVYPTILLNVPFSLGGLWWIHSPPNRVFVSPATFYRRLVVHARRRRPLTAKRGCEVVLCSGASRLRAVFGNPPPSFSVYTVTQVHRDRAVH